MKKLSHERVVMSLSCLLVAAAILAISSCSGGGGGSAAGTGIPASGKDSVVTAVRMTAPVSACANGGISVDAGIDANGSGALDASEVTSTQYVCNGAVGANGLAALVSVTSEPAGTNCTSGGKKVSVGPDSNGNGVLGNSEITSSDYICNGATGQAINSLVLVSHETAGGHCASGGLKVTTGPDANANGSLDPAEVASTDYVCNGPGSVIIQSITANPPVVRPGQSTTLTVSANDGAGSSLTYVWSAAQGNLTSTSTGTTTWTAPDLVGSYLVNVQASNGVSTVTGYATILVSVSPAGPIITSVSPAEIRTGDTITITGAGFGSSQGSSTVTIGGVAATNITSWSENQVRAVVPSGAITGSVIINSGGAASSPGYMAIPWSNGNLGLTNDANMQQNVKIISDGSGGAIITWEDYRTGWNPDIYAQRVNSAGTPQWTAGGVAISTATGQQANPQLVSDGSGGAIITWNDSRSGTSLDIYAQRVNSAGTMQWTANGVAISTPTGEQNAAQLVSDGSGGAIIAWLDYRRGTYSDIYAQRVNSAGTVQWTADGVAIATATGAQYGGQLVSDSSGGAILTWQDYRNGTNYDIYAQRMNSAGTVQWTANGVAIASAASNQQAPQLVSDGSGGAIITWEDYRSGNSDIYAQWVNENGQW